MCLVLGTRLLHACHLCGVYVIMIRILCFDCVSVCLPFKGKTVRSVLISVFWALEGRPCQAGAEDVSVENRKSLL